MFVGTRLLTVLVTLTLTRTLTLTLTLALTLTLTPSRSPMSSACLILRLTRTELMDGSIKHRSVSVRAMTSLLRRSSLEEPTCWVGRVRVRGGGRGRGRGRGRVKLGESGSGGGGGGVMGGRLG